MVVGAVQGMGESDLDARLGTAAAHFGVGAGTVIGVDAEIEIGVGIVIGLGLWVDLRVFLVGGMAGGEEGGGW